VGLSPGKKNQVKKKQGAKNQGHLKTFQLAQVRHLTAATAAVRACAFVHA
jgi:hypothetical protein